MADTAQSHVWSKWLRVITVWLFVIIGCLTFSAFVAVRWAEKQVLNADSWVELVAPLPKQPVVSTALGNFVSDQVFSTKAVEAKITDALPPKASFLAAPLTSQVRTLTTKAAQRLVASDAFQTIWTGANRAAMNRLLTTARGEREPVRAKINDRFDINLSGSTGQLRTALGSVSSAIPALQPAANKAIDLTADLKAKPRRIHQVIRTIDTLYKVLPLVALASLLSALAVAKRRRYTGMAIVVSIGVLMLFELIAIKWLRNQTLDQVKNPANLSAIEFIYDTLVGWLRNMIFIVLGIAAALYLLLLAAGPASWAKQLRSYTHSDRLHTSSVKAAWNIARQWVRQWEYYLWLGAAVIVIAILALFLEISGHAVINALLLIVSIIALLHIIATPRLSEDRAGK
jgi:hypothetical protein